ncbi:MFS transporter [Microaerobacter geothermalis]|uniref:MFS transporter n=1 Tax=Microaerobacter geothermalis TaxID=674972 RepID=UPI001F24DF0D|nr:MFS transporter [Microaerobacter geothermalis]MCF6093371.1 MFS transporter [Microaerobacter geothermalis]
MFYSKRLDGQTKLLLSMNALFMASVALSNTFVNVYIWKIKGDYITIAQFNLFIYLAMPFTFWIGGRLVKKIDRVISIRIGVALMALFYSMILILGKDASQYIQLLGLLLGIASGFYWLGYNILYFEITNPDNRDMFNGVNGFLFSGTGMIAPVLSGWFLSQMKQLTGYTLIFSISLGIFITAIIVSYFFHHRELHGVFHLGKVWKEAKNRTPWHFVMVAHYFQGIREGIYTFLIGLLVFISTSSEFRLGVYTFITSLVSLVSFFLAGKWIKPKKRNTSLLIGTTMLAVVVIPMFFTVNYVTLLILGIGGSFFFPFFTIPITSTTFDLIGENKQKAQLKVEYIVFREFVLNLGRITSITLFIILITITEKIEVIAIFLFFSNALLLFTWINMKHVPVTSDLKGKHLPLPTLFRQKH